MRSRSPNARLTIGEEVQDLPLRVAANYYLGTTFFVAGDYRRTDEFFSRILQLLAGDRFRERCGLAGFPVVMSRMFWTLALAERGEFDHGMAKAQEGIQLAETLDHPYSLVCALRGLGRVHGARGNLDDAIRPTERGLALARERHLPQLFARRVGPARLSCMCCPAASTDGLVVLEEALAAMEAIGIVQWRTPLLVHLGEAYLLASRRKDALTQAGALSDRCPRARPPRLRGLGPSPPRGDRRA